MLHSKLCIVVHFNGFQLLCFGGPVTQPEIFKRGQELGCEQPAAQQLRRTTEDAKRQRSKWEGAGWVLVEVAPPVKAWGCNPR
mgnify:CR=1 FL=1